MQIIVPIALTGIVFFGVYKLFELFVRRKERSMFIEKAFNSPDGVNFESVKNFSLGLQSQSKYGALKTACLLVGLGIGLLVGFIIDYTLIDFSVSEQIRVINQISDMRGIIYGASILMCGGFGLLVAFILEMKFTKKKEGHFGK